MAEGCWIVEFQFVRLMEMGAVVPMAIKLIPSVFIVDNACLVRLYISSGKEV